MISIAVKTLINRLFTVLGVTMLFVVPASANSKLHSAWSDLLAKHTVELDGGSATAVDYAGMQASHPLLKQYLNTLSSVPKKQYELWSKQKKLAFLINAYNAFTVDLILNQYPDIESIKDLGSWFSSPWKKVFIPLLGEEMSLDDIEHGLIRAQGVFDEPRIHFAVNCASVGCPALRSEAYTEGKLDSQLDHQTQRFLGDKSRNYLDGNTLYLSPIFKWYKDDFSSDFFAQYASSLSLSQGQTNKLLNGELTVRYMDYDWSLNRVQ